MKRTLCIVLAMSITLWGKALTGQTVGIYGGVNNASIRGTEGGGLIEYGSVVGMHLSILSEIPLQGRPYVFETGLRWSVKGFHAQAFGLTIDVWLHYLEVPILLKRYWDFSDHVRGYLSVGPYVGMGSKGYFIYSGTFLGLFELGGDGTIDWDDALKRYDVGMSCSAGLQIRRYHFAVSYDLGMINVDKSSDEIYHNVWRFSLGYALPMEELIEGRRK